MLKAHNLHIKPISIDNRHVRLSLLATMLLMIFLCRAHVKLWWKHERIFLTCTHERGFCQFIVARRSLRNFVALVIHFIIHSAKAPLSCFHWHNHLLLFIRILIARATTFFHVTYGWVREREKAHLCFPSFHHLHFFVFLRRSLNWDRKSFVCLWFI